MWFVTVALFLLYSAYRIAALQRLCRNPFIADEVSLSLCRCRSRVLFPFFCRCGAVYVVVLLRKRCHLGFPVALTLASLLRDSSCGL